MRRHSVSLYIRIQSQCWKIQSRITANTDTFDAVFSFCLCICICFRCLGLAQGLRLQFRKIFSSSYHSLTSNHATFVCERKLMLKLCQKPKSEIFSLCFQNYYYYYYYYHYYYYYYHHHHYYYYCYFYYYYYYYYY